MVSLLLAAAFTAHLFYGDGSYLQVQIEPSEQVPDRAACQKLVEEIMAELPEDLRPTRGECTERGVRPSILPDRAKPERPL